jgi:hypothetical protein
MILGCRGLVDDLYLYLVLLSHILVNEALLVCLEISVPMSKIHGIAAHGGYKAESKPLIVARLCRAVQAYNMH